MNKTSLLFLHCFAIPSTTELHVTRFDFVDTARYLFVVSRELEIAAGIRVGVDGRRVVLDNNIRILLSTSVVQNLIM